MKKFFSFNLKKWKTSKKGCNNKIIIVDKDNNEKVITNCKSISGLKITLIGKNNTVKLHKPFRCLNGSHIEINSTNAFVEIGKDCHIENVHMRLKFGYSQNLKIGDRTTIYGGAIVLDEDSCACIGSDCLMASGFEVWGSDGHCIIDIENQKLLNRAQDPVIIGDHCWFGLNCAVLKGTNIPKNCVIGMKSVLVGTYEEENVVICGAPGKIIKHGINWSSESPLYYKPPQERF